MSLVMGPGMTFYDIPEDILLKYTIPEDKAIKVKEKVLEKIQEASVESFENWAKSENNITPTCYFVGPDMLFSKY